MLLAAGSDVLNQLTTANMGKYNPEVTIAFPRGKMPCCRWLKLFSLVCSGVVLVSIC